MVARGIRNNNPGNIIWGKPGLFEGWTGTDGPFAVFDTPEHGIAAIGQNLRAYEAKGFNTVDKIIRRWSATDQDAYVAAVCRALGVQPFDVISLQLPTVMRPLVLAIIQQENGEQPYPVEMVTAALGFAVESVQAAAPIEEPEPTFTIGGADNSNWGGNAPRAKIVPATEPFVMHADQPTGAPVGAFLAFLPSILQAIPSLIQVFGHGDPAKVQEKADKAQVVTDLLVKATDAVNLQDAVEKMQGDPSAQAAAQAAIQQSWYLLQEVGGGIDAARKAVVDTSTVPLWKDRAFIVSVLLLLMAAAVGASVVLQPVWTADNRTTLLQTILNILWAVAGYFLGSSMSSAKKDDALAKR